jgi:GT2 family glycosyltransferase
MYFEDIELCHRVFRNREKIGFCTDLVVDHATGWSAGDPLRWRRGVEFARGALRFAETLNISPALMRSAGVARFASRIPFRASVESELVGTRCVARGFLNPRAPGLIELARSWSPARKEWEMITG